MNAQHVVLSKEVFEQIFLSGRLEKIRAVFQEGIKFCFNISESQLEDELNQETSIINIVYQANPSLPRPITNQNIEIELGECTIPNSFTEKSVIILGNDDEIKTRFENEFGIRWIKENEIHDDLFQVNFERVLEADKEIIDSDWESLFTPYRGQVSNALFINDRNFFTNEYNFSSFQGKRDIRNLGIENLVRAVDQILPINMAIPFHILICTEQSTIPNKEIILSRAITDLMNKLRSLRGYDITVEVLLYNSGTSHFKYTHNRRFIMNFYFGKVEHGFDMFKYFSRSKIEVRDDHFQMNNSLQKKTLSQQYLLTLNRFKELIFDAQKKISNNGQNQYEYRLFRNGGTEENIINRLFN